MLDDTLIQNLSGMIAVKGKELQVLQDVLEIYTSGYKTDQKAVDTEIQKGRDAVAEQVTALQGKVETLTAENVDLQAQVKELSNPEPIEEPIKP